MVDYNLKKTWQFEPDRSAGSLDDEIWTLNMVAVSASEQTRWPGTWTGTINITIGRYGVRIEA